MSIPQSLLEQSIQINIQQALQEDIGAGDITAWAYALPGQLEAQAA